MKNTVKKHELSVIIPTLNEEGFIEKLLQDIIDQHSDCEIIVSDSGSTDKTESIVKNFSLKHSDKNIRFIQASRKGVSLARNNGATHARGKYLVFLDADTRIPKGFFKNIIAEMKKRKLDAAGFKLKIDSRNIIDKSIFFIFNNWMLTPLQYTKQPCCFGAGIVVKKAIHNKVHGFSEEFKYCEDIDYVRKISKTDKFRVAKSTNIIFSARRFEDEGRLKVLKKYFITTMWYMFNSKNIKKLQFEYEFGKFSKSKEIAKN